MLLRSAHRVLPLLSEVLAVNYTIHGIITEIGVNRLNGAVQVDSRHGAPSEKKEDRIRENRVRCPAPNSNAQDIEFCGFKSPSKLSLKAMPRLRLDSLAHVAQICGHIPKRGQLVGRND